MADPFAAGHRAKAIADAKATEATAHEVIVERATAKGKAEIAKLKPVEQSPYVPSKPPWSLIGDQMREIQAKEGRAGDAPHIPADF